jgi:hypothetical protein
MILLEKVRDESSQTLPRFSFDDVKSDISEIIRDVYFISFETFLIFHF